MKSIDSNFKFVIVGGGTSGWITSLYIKKFFPEAQVTVIASSEIGILGAGEGSTPHLLTFLKEIDIPLSGVVKGASATIKNGIKFTNWNGDGTNFYQPFSQNPEIEHMQNGDIWTGFSLIDLERMAEDRSLDDLSLSNILSEENKVPFKRSAGNGFFNNKPDNQYGFVTLASTSIHFNANMLADYLQNIGVRRGIKLIDAKVAGFENDEIGNITNIALEGGSTVPCDFIFDCTGFRRLIIGNHFKSSWKSYGESLPVKKAVPFFIKHDGEFIAPYTESIAMKYGWVWKIPVQDRYGCGYVFDSDFITPEQAKQEVDELMGFEVESPRTLSFDPGSYDTTWINNCCAIGLSSGFVEPLEATSIWIQIASLRYFLQHISGVTLDDKMARTRYNQIVKEMNQDTLEFIHLHYLTKRNDSEFWTTFRQKNKHPERIQILLDELKYSIPDKEFFGQYRNYSPSMWYYVIAGARIHDPKIAKELFLSQTQGYRKEIFEQEKYKHEKRTKQHYQNCLDHNLFLDLLKQHT